MSLAAITVFLGGGLALLAAKAGSRGRLAAVLLLLVWCAVGLGWNGQKMRRHTAALREVTGMAHNPFQSFLELRRALAAVPPVGNGRTFLELRAQDFPSLKGRQLLTYFLHDRPLAGDWLADPGLLPEFLPAAEQIVPRDGCAWIVRMPAAGGFSLDPNETAAVARPEAVPAGR